MSLMAGVCLILAVFAAGCDARRVGSLATATDSAGITIVESDSPEWAETEGWTVAAGPSVSIGVLEGEPPYLFDRIRDVARMSDGRLVIADGGSGEVRLFDRSGRHLATLGGLGDGPGEFRDLTSMILIGDSILAFDGAVGRITWFGSSGGLLETTTADQTGNPVHPLRMYRIGGPLGEDLAMVVRAFPADMRPEPTVYWDTIPTLRYSRDGSFLDSVGEFSGMDTYSTQTRSGSLTFGRFSSVDVHEGSLYMTDGGSYEVRVYDPTRGLRRILRVTRDPRPVTDAVLDRYLNPLLELAETPEQRQRHAEPPHAEYLPWISRIVVDDDGHVWVREYQHWFDRTPERWGVFDPSGRWLGNVDMPGGFTPLQIGSDYVLGTARDEFGVQSVREYELQRSGEDG